MGQLLSAPVKAIVVERHGTAHYWAGVATMQGWRTNQEDAHTCAPAWCGDVKKGIFAVFDGHGGARSAKFCGVNLEKELQSLNQYGEHAIQESFLSLDRKLRTHLGGDDSGCTCICAIVEHNPTSKTYKLHVANLGDSRAILIKQGVRGVEPSATIDHKPSDDKERQRINAAGGFVSNTFPPRLDGAISLSRAFGDFEYKKNAMLPPKDQKMCPVPDIYEWTAAEGDTLVLACDGIFDVMSNQELADFVSGEIEKSDDLGAVCSKTILECLDRGSRDNMTLMIARLTNGEGHSKQPELLMGDYLTETNRTVKDNYISFAEDNGFSLTDPKLCSVCQKYFQNMSSCACKQVIYCGKDCQKTDWKTHKQVCTAKHKDPKHDGDSDALTPRSESSRNGVSPRSPGKKSKKKNKQKN